MRENQTFLQWVPGADEELLERVRDKPVYLTLDLDVLDPACMPGTGNPEAGGWFYYEMEPFLLMLDGMNLVGADVVELNPGLDPAQTSTITAAKIVRELLLILGKRSG
jgi:agmatinase